MQIFFVSRIYLPNNLEIIVTYNNLNSKLQYGFISGLVMSNNYARVYLYNGIFMQLAAAIMFIKLFNKDKNVFGIVKLAILLVGIYVSNTRGFWLGTIGAVVISMIYYLWRFKKFNLTLRNSNCFNSIDSSLSYNSKNYCSSITRTKFT